ncbi:MAG: ATP-binding protein [Coriobacteriia bacterium]|nr:ATP-binding protein [Coriobacteriia bacterium]
MTDYRTRTLETVLRSAVSRFRAVELTGPRQSGKTTLLRHVFADTHAFVSLDDPLTAEEARSDPRGFLARRPAPLIVDEFQKAPDLARYIKIRIDESGDAKGLYILTGSENLTISRTVSESLAGRVAVLRLLPLTVRELRGESDSALPWESDEAREARPASVVAMWEQLLRGYYPEVALNRSIDTATWYESYLETYVQRDVRSLRAIGDLSAFTAFLMALAARSATVLDLSALSRDIGISVNTAKAWLAVLEATYQVILLPAYSNNVGTRLAKRPRIYFMDVGMLCHLVGLASIDHALRGPMAGQIVETAVVADIWKSYHHAGARPRMFYWRTSGGAEVDIVIETPTGLVPVEVKSASTANRRMAEGIAHFRRRMTAQPVRGGWVVHPGETSVWLGDETVSLPYAHL